jgi:hypothetical protein
MQQRPEKFNTADGDPESTLVAPRFDDEEARRAHPVVPLAEAGASAPHAGAYARGGLRRSWPTALLAVALLAVAAVGGALATMYMRRAPSTPTAAQTPAAVAPAQAAEVPPQVEPPPAATATREVTREVADAEPETRAPRDTQARRDEAAPVRVRDEGGRDDRKELEDEDKRGRDRDKERDKERGRRRGRGGDDEAEKEMRKAQKRAKDKAPRLVDVLVHPGN